MNQQKPIEAINSKQLIENSNPSPMDKTTLNQKTYIILYLILFTYFYLLI